MELSYSQVGRYEVLLLVDVRDVTPVGLFTNDGDTVGVLRPDPFGLRFAFLYLFVFVLVKKGGMRNSDRYCVVFF